MSGADILRMVALGAIWGGAFPLLRIATPGFGPLALISVRLATAALVLVALLQWRRQRVDEGAGRLFVLGLLNTAVPFTLFSYATLSITAGLASLLNATTPMFGALIAWLWLGEKLTWTRAAGVAIGFAGIASIVWGEVGAHAEGAILGVAAGLVAAALYGLAASYTRRRFPQTDPLALAAGSCTGALVGIAPLAALTWPAETPAPAAWASAAVLGVVCTAVAYLVYFRLLRNVGAARAVTVTFLIPVFGIFWGAVFLGEPVTPKLLASCGVVLFGTALALGLFDSRSRSVPEPPASG